MNTQEQSQNSNFELFLPDGQPVEVRKRAKGGSTKRVARVEPRAIHRVIVPLRHSQAAGRDELDDANDRFFGPQYDLSECLRLCLRNGWDIHSSYVYLNYTGGELDQWDELLELIEAGEADAIVIPRLDRFARTTAVYALIDRLRACGGHLISARDKFDIYNPSDQGILGYLVGKAYGERQDFTDLYRKLNQWKADQGATKHGAYGYGWLEVARDVVQPDGTARHHPRGSLFVDETERPFAVGIYRRLLARVPKQVICDWLNESGQRTRGRRRRTGERLPGYKWTTGTLTSWATNPINKGWVCWGSYVVRDVHDALVSESDFDRVAEMYAKGSNVASSPSSPEIRLLSGVLRCAGCRSAMTYRRTTGQWACGAGDSWACPAHGTAFDKLLAPLVEQQLLERTGARTADVTVAGDVGAETLSRLRAAKSAADQKLLDAYADEDLKDRNRDAFLVQCELVRQRAEAASSAYAMALRQADSRRADQSLVQRWPAMSMVERNAAVRATWPVIWVRKGEHLDAETGRRRRRPLQDRVWPIPVDEVGSWALPKRGWDPSPECHQSVPWWDGSQNETVEQRRAASALTVQGAPPGAPVQLVARASSPEELARWSDAREHFQQYNRTDAEVDAALDGSRGQAKPAARELGMSDGNLRQRLRKRALAEGRIEEPVLIRARQQHYQDHGRSDEELRAALVISTGNYSQAAREVGMPVSSFYVRAKRIGL